MAFIFYLHNHSKTLAFKIISAGKQNNPDLLLRALYSQIFKRLSGI
jgi:hypothetical protein